LNRKFSGAQSLFYTLLVTSGRYNLLDVADAVGVELDSFYKYLNGSSYMPIDLVPRLLKILDSADAAELHRFLVPQSSPRRRHTNSLLHEAAELSAAIGRVHQSIVSALDDGRLSEPEKRKIRATVNGAREELNDIETVLDADHDDEQGRRLSRIK